MNDQCSLNESSKSSHIILSAACPDDLTTSSSLALCRILEESERVRLARFKDEESRKQFLLAHALLRIALSSRYSVLPSDWLFDRTPLQAPRICHPKVESHPHLSLSHTQSLVVCAISPGAPIGVDVEKIDLNKYYPGLESQILSELEKQDWEKLDNQTKTRTFFHLWTLKESFLKATGKGLSIPPTEISFCFKGPSNFKIKSLPEIYGNPTGWSFRLLEPTPEHVCAFAIQTHSNHPVDYQWNRYGIDELVSLMDLQNKSGGRCGT